MRFAELFEDGEHYTAADPMPEDKGGWFLLERAGIERLRVHPSHLVDAGELTAVALYQVFAGGGMGAGPLPETGGYLDQASYTMTALSIIGRAEQSLKPRRKEHA